MKIFAFLLLVTIVSCNKLEQENNDYRVDDKLIITDNLNFYGFNYKPYQEMITEVKGPIIIIRVKLWRKNQNCLHKIGVCKIEILPDDKSGHIFDEGREIDIPFLTEFEGGNIFIYFSQDVSSYSQNDLELSIDGDVYVDDENDISQDSFKAPDGIYDFDPNLGDYGGYTIPIVKIP